MKALISARLLKAESTVITWERKPQPLQWRLLRDPYQHISMGGSRFSRKYVLGNILDRNLKDLWPDPEYVSFASGSRLSLLLLPLPAEDANFPSHEEGLFGIPSRRGGLYSGAGVVRSPVPETLHREIPQERAHGRAEPNLTKDYPP